MKAVAAALTFLWNYRYGMKYPRQKNDIHTGSFSIYSGAAPPFKSKFTSFKPHEPYADGVWRFFVGEEIMAEFTILVMDKEIDCSIKELQTEIDKLPNLETIYIDPQFHWPTLHRKIASYQQRYYIPYQQLGNSPEFNAAK